MKNDTLFFIFLRYLVAVLIGLNGLFIIYQVFTPLTINTSFLIFSLFENELSLSGNSILINGLEFVLIDACIAGAAYYLIIVLNLATPMESIKRIKSLVFLLVSLFALNILRIILLGFFAMKSMLLFNAYHEFFWYAGSTIFVIVLWFINIKLFRIKTIPLITDIRKILE